MRKSRFSEEQIIGILWEQEGAGTAADVRAPRTGSTARLSSGGRPGSAAWMCPMPAVRRQAVAHLISEHEARERRACKAVHAARSPEA
jgi:hypothetical protein